MNRKAKWGTQEFTSHLFKYYMKQCDLIEEVYQSQFNSQKKNKNQRVESLYLLLYSMHDTASSIGMLSVNQKINESYMLARALVEKIINYIYLLFCDEEDYKRYLSYTKLKGYRNLKKDIKVGEIIAELKWSGDFNLNNDPELKRAVELFTSEKKRKPIQTSFHEKPVNFIFSWKRSVGFSVFQIQFTIFFRQPLHTHSVEII